MKQRYLSTGLKTGKLKICERCGCDLDKCACQKRLTKLK